MSDPDPWLPDRLRHEAAIVRAEQRIFRTTWSGMRDWLGAVEQRTLGIQAAAPPPDPTSAWAEQASWIEVLDGAILPAVSAVMWQRIRAEGGREVAAVEAAVDRRLTGVRNRLRGIPDSAFSRIRDELRQGYSRGEDIDALRQRIEDTLNVNRDGKDNYWRNRAEAIARTETMGAYNGGAQLAWADLARATGEQLEKGWLATLDKRTRETHFAADGQRVPLDQPFTVGGWQLMEPGDPDGPAQEVINCRCTMIRYSAGEASVSDLGRGSREDEGQTEVERRAGLGQRRAGEGS
jgi:hypothetical protein